MQLGGHKVFSLTILCCDPLKCRSGFTKLMLFMVHVNMEFYRSITHFKQILKTQMAIGFDVNIVQAINVSKYQRAMYNAR